jgi:hypothetical protein
MSKRLLSGRDRLASIAIPQSGHRFGLSGILVEDGMMDTAALDRGRSGSAVLFRGRMTGMAGEPQLHREFLAVGKA